MLFKLEVHPAAALWPMMPENELHELAESIKANGQRVSIVRWHGLIIDGRNRLTACLLAGVEPHFEDRDTAFADDSAVWDFCFDINQHRRHLTTKQKQQVIVARLKAAPEMSNRQIAAEVKADHKTVAAQRQHLESTGEIPQLDATKGRDEKKPRCGGALWRRASMKLFAP